LRVFRDETSLAADPALWSSIVRALDASHYFILLASPGAARSPWVGQEVTHWCAKPAADDGTKPTARILIALTEGELVWDRTTRDFDWSQTTALPPTLHGVFDEEPRYIDIRWARSVEQLSLSHPRFRDAVAEFAAPLHGVSKEEIAGEEVRQHRRTVRIARTAAAVLVALTTLAVAGAVVALAERSHAISQRRRAVSRLAASRALDKLDSNLDLALLFAVAAYREAPTAEAANSLFRGAEKSAPIAGFLDGGGRVFAVTFSNDGKRVAAAGDGGVVTWDSATKESREVSPLAARAVSFGGDHSTLAFLAEGKVKIWKDASPPTFRELKAEGVTSLAFAAHSSLLALGTQNGELVVWSNGRFSRPLKVSDGAIAAVSSSRDGKFVATAASDGVAVVRLRALGHAEVWQRVREDRPVVDVSFGTTPATVIAVRNDGRVSAWNVSRRRAKRVRGPFGSNVLTAAVGPLGDIATGSATGAVTVDSIALGEQGGPVIDVAFSPDGGEFATASTDGTIVLWRVSAHGSDLRMRCLSRVMTEVDDGAFVAKARLVGLGRVGAVGRPEAVVQDLGGTSCTELSLPDASSVSTRVAVGGHGRVAVGGAGFVGLWSRGTHLQRLDGAGQTRSLAFDSGGRAVAQGTDRGAIIVWELTQHHRRTISLGDGSPVTAVAFGSPHSVLATGSQDGRVTLWDIDGQERPTALTSAGGPPVRAVAFSPDGVLLAVAAGQDINLWDVRHDTPAATLHASGEVTHLGFSPDGTTLASSEKLATGPQDVGRLVLWNVHDLPIRSLGVEGRGAPIAALDFDPDGLRVAAIRFDGTLMVRTDALWNVSSAITRICSVVGRPLKSSEWKEISPEGAPPSTCDDGP
jgi:WD40 repeat protein